MQNVGGSGTLCSPPSSQYINTGLQFIKAVQSGSGPRLLWWERPVHLPHHDHARDDIWGVPRGAASGFTSCHCSNFFGDFRHLFWASFLCKWAKILISWCQSLRNFGHNFCQLALMGKFMTKILAAINLSQDHKWSIPLASLLPQALTPAY